MVVLEDPITADPTSRLLTEEDEELARGIADQYQTTPDFELACSCPSPVSVVFLVGPAASILLSTLFQRGKVVGSISVPELQRLRSPYNEEYGGVQTHHVSKVAEVSDKLWVVASTKQLQPEQATTWTKHVMNAFKPYQVLTVSTMLAMEYRGPGSAADEDLIFSLQYSAASIHNTTETLPPLPCGTLLNGLPAALTAHCVQQQLPSSTIVGVQLGPAPDAKFIGGLAAAVTRAVSSIDEEIAPFILKGPSLEKQIKQAADKLYSTSASNSMYI